MSQVIAGVYEIQHQIGAGGGGIVYLGWHLRLNKRVVLKADKRTLRARPEALRREVDMLKGLSHTYIPQVYDFVQENGVVYTIMDYIEGESLDKLLSRKQALPQPLVIKWACQLLEALIYLHSRPPYGILHGDIKPANIMLRPDGNICLIDYNIALALGENGAVKVGFSRGYASPEHYGADYLTNGGAQAEITQTMEMDGRRTETFADQSGQSGPGSAKEKRGMMLDVRSDIYSLGATLYHLLSGIRPAQEAAEVKPLETQVCSPAVSAILQKAMAPVPDERYQSAQEMLLAFRQLHTKDARVLRRKRRMRAAAAGLAGLFLTGGFCAFTGLKQLEQRQAALAMAEYSADALAKGNVSKAMQLAFDAIPEERNIFEAPVAPQAQKALTDALGVYDLADGFKAFDVLELPSAPLKIAISPGGKYFAVVYAYELAVFETETQRELVTLSMQSSALSDVVFTDDSCIIYAGDQGITAYDVSAKSALWCGDIATTLAVSADSAVVAAVNRDDDYAVLYRVSDGKKIGECSFCGQHLPVAANDIFADPENEIFALNEDGSRLAASFSDGGLVVFDLEHPKEDLILYEESDYTHFEGGFCSSYFAFAAEKSGQSDFGLIDTQRAVFAGGYNSRGQLHVKTDKRGIYLSDGNLLVRIAPDTLAEIELAYTENVNINGFSVGNSYVLTATDDNGFSFFDSGANRMSSEICEENCDFVVLTDRYAIVGNRNEPSIRLLKLENHSEAQLLCYDARYPHEEARISQDQKTAMLFDYQGFRVYSLDGTLIKEEKLPDAEQVYDQQFVREEEDSYLEVIWYDGTVRRYSAADGTLLSEYAGEAPQKDLYEEFFTDQYRIESSLHEAPKVYDLKSGRQVAVLEEDSYLTYVNQVGEYIVTEYISASGERYGLLLNHDLETLARLPKLCDVVDGTAIFDYGSGNLRQCRLYSLQELIALGEAQ